MSKITENTLVPVSLVLSILGGAGFVTYVYFQTSANAKAIEEIKAKQDAIAMIQTDVAVMKNDIATIKEILDSK